MLIMAHYGINQYAWTRAFDMTSKEGLWTLIFTLEIKWMVKINCKSPASPWPVINSSRERADVTVSWTIFETGLIYMLAHSSHPCQSCQTPPCFLTWQHQRLDFLLQMDISDWEDCTHGEIPIKKKSVMLMLLIWLIATRSIMFIKIHSGPNGQCNEYDKACSL